MAVIAEPYNFYVYMDLTYALYMYTYSGVCSFGSSALMHSSYVITSMFRDKLEYNDEIMLLCITVYVPLS